MRVIYSVGARLGGGGIGDTAYQAVRSIYGRGHLAKLIVSSYLPTEIDSRLITSMGWLGRFVRRMAIYDPTANLTHLADELFDLFASRNVDSGDIFHGWSNYSLHTLRRAKKRGAVTILERPSSHALTQYGLLLEEYEKHGLKKAPAHPRTIRKTLQEFEEADYVLVPSQFAYDSFIAHGFPAQKLVMIPYGVDIERFAPRPKNDEVFRALFVGQICLRKGISYLLRAWSELGLKQAELMLVGSFNLRRDAVEILKEYQGKFRLTLTGYVNDPAALYNQASLFVLPSIEEGSALVSYEAMASGLPVIVTSNSGSVARDGVEGYVVPIRDVEALKDRIWRLYEDPQLRKEMGRAARRRAEEFTWERYGQHLLETYGRLLGGERDA